MNKNNENSHTTKTSHQLNKNYVFQRGSETIQHVAPFPTRGYVTYSSSEIIDHGGDGQWQTRYGSSTEEIMPRDHRDGSNYYANNGNFHPNASHPRGDIFRSSHNQNMPKSRNDYRSDDPVFDEFLSTLMESFEGYDNPNIIGYRTEFAPRVSYYNGPFSRPDSPSTRGSTSLGPENGKWSREHQYDQPRFRPVTPPTKQTQFNYPDSSVRIYDVHQRTEWLPEPGKQHSEPSPRQNFGYRDHQYAPDNTYQQRNSPRPLLTTRFGAGNLSNAGGHGYSPTGEVEYGRNSPKEGYNYSYAPPVQSAPRDTMARPEMETNWEVKGNKQPNNGEKISDMANGALNFAKKSLNHVPYLPENGNTRPKMANRWQLTNQPKFWEKSSDNGSLDLPDQTQYSVPTTQEKRDTRPEISMVSSQGKGHALPEMAKSWLTKQINTGEKNPHNETLDYPNPSQSATTASQGNGNTRPEFSRSSSQGPEFSRSGSQGNGITRPEFSRSASQGDGITRSEFSRSASQGDGNNRPDFSRSASQGNGNIRPDFSRSASQGNGNTRPEFSRSASQGNGNTRPEFSRSASLGNGNNGPEFSRSASQGNGNNGPELFKSASQGKGNGFPEMAKSWFSKQQNRGEKNPHKETLDFPTPASNENGNNRPEFSRSPSQRKGNARPEMENHWELTNQPNKSDLNSPTESPFPLPSSQENEYGLPGNTGGNANHEMVNQLDGSNGSEINKQPNIREKFSKFGAMNSAKKSSFSALFSK